MSNQVIIRGCFSVSGGKGMHLRGQSDTVFELDNTAGGLIMQGNSDLPDNIIQVGNQIEINLEDNIYDKQNSYWIEKTDKPYIDTMGENNWMNMIEGCKDSHVFDHLYGSSAEAAAGVDPVNIVDPPTVTVGEGRKLEFMIYLRGEGTRKNFLMLAEQNILVEDGQKRNPRVVFTVYNCGFVRIPSEEEEEDNPIGELEDILSECAYVGGEKPEMKDVRDCVNRIPKENFEEITVIYDNSMICEFNGWGEET